MTMELRPYQESARRAIWDKWSEGDRATLLVLPTGCHAAGEKVLKADGTIIAVEDVAKGDYLCGSDGTPRLVTETHTGIDSLFKITPIKGTPFVVTGNHPLTLVRTNLKSRPKYPSQMPDDSLVDISVNEWLSWSNYKKHIHKLIRCSGIEKFMGSDDNLPISPYFLGILLGDGGLSASISVTTQDKEVVKVLEDEAETFGMHLRQEPAGFANTYFFVTNNRSAQGCKGSTLHRHIKELGLRRLRSKDKHVPQRYKIASMEKRLEIIAGLVDSDGSLTCGGYDFISKSEQLSEDLAFMCRSVGLAAYVSTCRKSCQTGHTGVYYRVSISGDCTIIPCKVERKKAPDRNQKKDVLRTGFSVKSMGSGTYYAFTVDGDHRYLLDDCTITHNTGKTVVFSAVAKDDVEQGGRVLILAHRSELLDQAADKLNVATGLGASVEKADQTAIGSWFSVTVGSVQTMMRANRLQQFPQDHFSTIIVDEAHHAVSDSYRKVLDYFSAARILGVTATADRGDRRNLGEVFDSIAYEYTMPSAIRDEFLCSIKAQTIPLKLDLSGVAMQSGDFKLSDIDTALDPYLYQIADEMIAAGCMERKVVVFLPLIKTSQKFRDILQLKGFDALEVNGESSDRAEILERFDRTETGVLCNSMLLTEGWDCPDVDCIVVLRPTKIRSLYCLDESTEILTAEGWKRNVAIGEPVATFDIATGNISYKPTIATVRRPLEKDEFFCSITGPQIDIRVTNNHRMIYDNKRKLGWKFHSAEKLADLKDGSWIPISGRGIFKGVPLTNDELRFIGWVLSDGTINKTNGQITITQGKHQPWLESIQKCIDKCGFKHNRFERSRNGFVESSLSVVWTISRGKPRGRDKHLRGWGNLASYMSKQISSSLFDNMTESQFDIMLEAIHLGDGAKQKGQSWQRHSYHISTGDKVYANRLQIMALQRGWKANISTQISQSGNNCYILHMKKKDRLCIGSTYDGRPTWKKEKHSSENCWCVQTEAGTLITRRNGKVAIMGNCQMVGRGTRISPGKDHLLLLDFLWHTERHELCHPAHLICEDDEVARQMTANLEDAAGCPPLDIIEAEEKAASNVMVQREKALAQQLEEMKNRKRKLVDPLQFEMSISAIDLVNYVPSFGWELAPPSDSQIKSLEKAGIFPDEIGTAGKASLLLDRIAKRRQEGLATPRQIRQLEGRGFLHVGQWSFEDASSIISRIANNGWRTPANIDPAVYAPDVSRGVA